jgi:WD40 repeat protein
MKIKVEKIHNFKGHNDCVYTLEPSSVDTEFFSGAGDGMVVKWDLTKPDEGELIAKLSNSIYALHHHRDSNFLIVGNNYSGIHVIDWQQKKEIRSLQLTDAAIFEIKSIDNLLLVGTGNGTLITVNLKTLKVLDRIQLSEKSIRSMAINEKHNEISIGYSDNFIRVLDLADFSIKYSLPAHTNSVFTLQYSEDERYLISGSRDARLKVWDVAGGYTLVNEVVAHLFAINSIAKNPSGKYFATGSMDKSIKVWASDDQQLLKVIDRSRHAGHGTSVNKLLWMPYGNQLISASDDRTISVWNIIFE